MSEQFISPDTVVDLTNCDREPIHIPGKIQPHGYLLAVNPSNHQIVMASHNAGANDVVGKNIDDVLHCDTQVLMNTPRSGEKRRPILLSPDSKSLAFVHQSDDLVVIEIEDQQEAFSSDADVRRIVLQLHSATEVDDLLTAAAPMIRSLTGFDRVMIYKFDKEWNGEVVAEAKRDDLDSFYGLHYPASDIPAQARELYRRNWIRLIADVNYEPANVEPVVNPHTAKPLDMSHSVLRSVSPIHIEYLQNMGVTASMSVSLMVDGELWGLIACHHYSGAHRPNYQTRLDAEFLGQALSLHISSLLRVQAHQHYVDARFCLETIRSNFDTFTDDLQKFVNENGNDLVSMVDAAGVVLRMNGQTATFGAVPQDHAVESFRSWASQAKAFPVVTDRLTERAPELEAMKQAGSGVLAFSLSIATDDFIAWFRPEIVQTVSWGGDPEDKPVIIDPSGIKRLSPRGSFELWKTTVERRSLPWDEQHVTVATDFARALVTRSIKDAQDSIRLSRLLQATLLSDQPANEHEWTIDTHFDTGDGGRIGGDWWDVIHVADGSIVVVLGDVAGHGIDAAATMSQLRTVLHAYLFENSDPGIALSRLNRWVANQLPDEMATCVVARLEQNAKCTIASAGHLPPVTFSSSSAQETAIVGGPSLGLIKDASYEVNAIDLANSELLLFTDGLIERRSEGIDKGLERLCTTLVQQEWPLADLAESLHKEGESVNDDVTIVRVSSLSPQPA